MKFSVPQSVKDTASKAATYVRESRVGQTVSS